MTFDARHGFAFAVLGATMLCAGTANAHFILTAPAADLEQNGVGDPQKEFPCGGAGTETGMITAYQAGDTVTISVEETIFHPGHFRVALAVDDISELPPWPEVTEGNTACGTVEIMDPPVFPVLADGMLLHTEQLQGEQSFDVVLPDDVECEACTLQVLMFMQEHGAPCF
ncbi:MAG TPA: SCE4755 family polysaccharide monooxygenase-like protein, partial [Nannocystaceae bacterium]|nr:SCE4755 family polysaccharide monooxygenase-like protein [Nannocystaceae bacterium]